MKEFKPIAMRCNQQQYDEIKQILIDNEFKLNELNGTFDEYIYLVNNQGGKQKNICNLNHNCIKDYNRTAFETWNKDIFLEYCGIEIENNWIPKIGDWVVSKKTNNKPEQIVSFHDDINMSLKGRELAHCNINNYRKAEPHEIPNNQNNNIKQPNLNDLLEETKKRYPNGTKFKCANGNNCKISSNIVNHDNLKTMKFPNNGIYQDNFWLHLNGKWAEIIEPAKPVETKSKYQIAAEEAMERFKDIQIGDEYVSTRGNIEIATKLPEMWVCVNDCYIDCGAGYLWQYDKPDNFGYKINKQNSEYPFTKTELYGHIIHSMPDPSFSLQEIGYESSSLFDAFDYKSSLKQIQPNQLIIKKKIVMDTKINPTQSINTNLKIKK